MVIMATLFNLIEYLSSDSNGAYATQLKHKEQNKLL
jgi:hypothetical protein